MHEKRFTQSPQLQDPNKAMAMLPARPKIYEILVILCTYLRIYIAENIQCCCKSKFLYHQKKNPHQIKLENFAFLGQLFLILEPSDTEVK